jgi:hypothetical protein
MQQRVGIVVVVGALVGLALGLGAHWLTTGEVDTVAVAGASSGGEPTTTAPTTTEPATTTIEATTTTTEATTTSTTTGGGGPADPSSGYTEEVEHAFMTSCVAAASGVADAEGLCQCAYDKIVETVPFDEFLAFDRAVRDDPSATPPPGVIAATNECVRGGAPPTPTSTIIS